MASKVTTTYAALAQQKSFFQKKRIPLKTQCQYDLGDDRQARVYSSLFAQEWAWIKGERILFANTRAWLEGRGAIFPDLMATLRGERPLFANLRATIARLIEEFKARGADKPKEGPQPASEKPEESEGAAYEREPKPLRF